MDETKQALVAILERLANFSNEAVELGFEDLAQSLDDLISQIEVREGLLDDQY